MYKPDNELPSRIEPPIITPLEPYTRNLIEWVARSYLPSMVSILAKHDDVILDEPEFSSFSRFFKITLLKAYGFDGYDFITDTIKSADGKENLFRGDYLPVGLMAASFFGLPTRVEKVVDGVPKLTGWQIVRNFFGGWNVADKSKKRFEKKGWEIAALIIKILIIFPLKVVTLPLKILLNVVKLFTEVLPALLWFGLTTIIDIGALFVDRNLKSDLSIIPDLNIVLKVLFFIGAVIVTAPLMMLQYALVLLYRVGMLLTSPEKSARLAFALGRTLRISWFGNGAETVISYIMGVLGALLSLTLSAVLWTLLLPLALGTLTTLIPSLMSAITWVAQLPFVAGTLAWFSSLSVVTSSVAFVNSFFAVVGHALVVAFGPAVTKVAILIGVQVPATIMAVGLTLGLLVPPIAASLSWVADQLSNMWTKWIMQEGGPLTWVFSFRGKTNTSTLLKGHGDAPYLVRGSSMVDLRLTQEQRDAAVACERATHTVDQVADFVENVNRDVGFHLTEQQARNLIGGEDMDDMIEFGENRPITFSNVKQ